MLKSIFACPPIGSKPFKNKWLFGAESPSISLTKSFVVEYTKLTSAGAEVSIVPSAK